MTSPEPLTISGRGVQLRAEHWPAADARGTVLLLHGGGQTRHSWQTTGARLSEADWTTLALDARGHGESDWATDGDYSLDALVDDLADVVDHGGTAAGAADSHGPVLVGASMGGITSLAAVGERRVAARGLVLVDVTPHVNPAGAARIRDFMTANLDGFESLEEVADAVAAYNPLRPRPRHLDGLRKNVRQHDDGRWYWHWDPAFMQLDDEPWRQTPTDRLMEAARHVTVPTLLVYGTHSDIVTTDGVDQLRELIPHATVLQAKAGHMIAGDDNDVFTDGLLDFLSQHC